MRFGEDSKSGLAEYVGRRAEVRKQIIVYDRGIFGRLGVPAGEWPIGRRDEVLAKLDPGAIFEVIGVASRRIESGKHYYLACRYRLADKEVTFDYPAEAKFIKAEYLVWQ